MNDHAAASDLPLVNHASNGDPSLLRVPRAAAEWGISMKQRISVLLTVLALLSLLTACGSRQQEADSDAGQSDSSVTDDIQNAQPGAEALPDDGLITAPDTTPGTAPALTDDPATESGVPLDQMLKNARVHDRDGDLLDGENSASR